MHFCPKNDILKSEKSPRKEAAMPTLTDPAVIKELLQRVALPPAWGCWRSDRALAC